MYPLLFKLGPIPIHTYGAMIAIGFLAGAALNVRLGRRTGIDVDRLLDLNFWSMIVGFLGARLVFVLTQFSVFLKDPVAVFRVWEGGFVFWGGPLAVLPFGIWFLRRYRLPVWKTMDVMICGLTLGHALGRLGCLGAGCCYGKPTHGSFGIQLHSALVEPALRGIPLHPTQLYEAVSLAVLLALLLWIFKRKRFEGQVFLTYAMVYPVLRSVIEVFRGDLIRGFVFTDWLSTSQFISVLVFIAASITLLLRLREERS